MKALFVAVTSYFGHTQAISSDMHRLLADEGVHVEHRMLEQQAELF